MRQIADFVVNDGAISVGELSIPWKSSSDSVQAYMYFSTDGGKNWTADYGTSANTNGQSVYTPYQQGLSIGTAFTAKFESSNGVKTYTLTPSNQQTYQASTVANVYANNNLFTLSNFSTSFHSPLM